MIVLEIILGFVTAVAGVVFALWYEGEGVPRLYFNYGETSDLPALRDGSRPRYLHLTVTNRPKSRRWVTRQTAYSCHGTIVFERLDDSTVTNRMAIRWTNTAEPVRFQMHPNGRLDPIPEPSLIRASRFMDIPPDETEPLDIAVRFHNEADAFGWNSDSHARRGRNQEFRLPLGEYVAHVHLTTGDSVFETDVRFRNPEEISGFDLVREQPLTTFKVTENGRQAI